MGALLGYIFSNKKLNNNDIYCILKRYKNGKSKRLNWDTYWCLGGPYWRGNTLRMKAEVYYSGNFRSNSPKHGKCHINDDDNYIGVDSCRIKDLVMDPLESLKIINKENSIEVNAM